jgi:hypothetical protein
LNERNIPTARGRRQVVAAASRAAQTGAVFSPTHKSVGRAAGATQRNELEPRCWRIALPAKFESLDHLCMRKDSASCHSPPLGQIDYDAALEFLMK